MQPQQFYVLSAKRAKIAHFLPSSYGPVVTVGRCPTCRGSDAVVMSMETTVGASCVVIAVHLCLFPALRSFLLFLFYHRQKRNLKCFWPRDMFLYSCMCTCKWMTGLFIELLITKLCLGWLHEDKPTYTNNQWQKAYKDR